MPKQQLDQTQPAKVKAKVMAQRKKAKLLKEQAKLEELRKQFPKLFSPEKVKNIEQRKKQLVQSSLKKEVCAEDGVDDVENMPENTNHRRPFSSTHKADTPQKKGDVKTPLTASNSQRVLQVLASPTAASSSGVPGSSRVSLLPGCSCQTAQLQAEGVDDVENQQCDICAQIAPLANTRKDVVHALRNFLHKPSSTHMEVVGESVAETGAENKVENKVEEKEEMSLTHKEEKEKEDSVIDQSSEGPDATISTPTQEEANFPFATSNSLHISSSNNNLLEDLEMEMPKTDAIMAEEEPPVFEEEILDVQSESTKPAHDGFNETLLKSLAAGRVRGRVVGRKEVTDHVEFIFKIQVLKEGYSFQEINDSEYLTDCMSPSSHVTTAHSTENESPYVIQMCILRRYSDFEKLQEKLILESKKVNVDIKFLQTNFPAKQYFRSFGKRWADPTFLQCRERGLTQWMEDDVLPTLSAVSNSKKRNALKDSFVKAIHRFMSM